MRDRVSAVIVEDDKIAMIKRTWNGELYYVFPGGGIEVGETPEHAAKREIFEELGLIIEVKDCLLQEYFEGTRLYFRGKAVSGTFGSGKGEEFNDPHRNRGLYEPVWLPIRELTLIDVRPRGAAAKIQETLLRLQTLRLERSTQLHAKTQIR